jgi:hypothetical protein
MTSASCSESAETSRAALAQCCLRIANAIVFLASAPPCLCPSQRETVGVSTPLSMQRVANKCRRSFAIFRCRFGVTEHNDFASVKLPSRHLIGRRYFPAAHERQSTQKNLCNLGNTTRPHVLPGRQAARIGHHSAACVASRAMEGVPVFLPHSRINPCVLRQFQHMSQSRKRVVIPCRRRNFVKRARPLLAICFRNASDFPIRQGQPTFQKGDENLSPVVPRCRLIVTSSAWFC